jgi:hypothetical protein
VDSWSELQKESSLSWVRKYEEEKKKRIEAEQKYETIIKRLKELAVENYYEKLKNSEVEGEWNEERMDVIGQNGNTGDHYQYELWNYASEDRPKKDEDND